MSLSIPPSDPASSEQGLSRPRPGEVRPRVKDHVVEVSDVTDYTPWYRRVTFDARGLFTQFTPERAGHIQATFPALGDGAPVQRSYTIIPLSATSFAIEFVIHSPAGPGCAWAATAQPGMTLSVSEPPYALAIPPAHQAILIGDCSALAAIRLLVSGMAATMAVSVSLVDSHRDRDLIPTPLGDNIQVQWLDELSMSDVTTITDGVDPADCYLWVAGERRLAKTVRDVARSTLRLGREAHHVQTYWIAT